MALNLRKALVRNGLIAGGVCLVLSGALATFAGGMQVTPANLAWPLLLALGIGGFTAWQGTNKIKQGVLRSLPEDFSYLQLSQDARESRISGVKIDWETIDDFAIQLEMRGYIRLGEFTTWPLPKHFVGVAACFIDRSATTLVEMQTIHMNDSAPSAARAHAGGVHLSIMSVLGGNISVNTTDHKLMATNYLIRGDYTAVASFPGVGLLQLLEKHARLVTHVRARSGKKPMAGLNMNRYVLLQRERFEQARKRITRMSGYEIARRVDAFEAAPRTNWLTSSSRLSALVDRPFEELDTGKYTTGQAPILNAEGAAVSAFDPATPAAAAAVVSVVFNNGGATPATAMMSADAEAVEANERSSVLMTQIGSSANWFYWVAALSLVNTVVAILGSKWSFIIGLGLPQLLISEATRMRLAADPPALLIATLWGVSFAMTAFFAACGWFAGRPSIVAFIAGAALFALDSIIFLIAGDWIGVAFHAVVLYMFWKGITATREYKEVVTR
ncbi:MAG: hypothetical protein ABI905_11755 [Betaproteobacteria bacterium]